MTTFRRKSTITAWNVLSVASCIIPRHKQQLLQHAVKEDRKEIFAYNYTSA